MSVNRVKPTYLENDECHNYQHDTTTQQLDSDIRAASKVNKSTERVSKEAAEQNETSLTLRPTAVTNCRGRQTKI